jgi:hypothetical protein
LGGVISSRLSGTEFAMAGMDMPIRHSQGAKHRSSAWSSSAETQAPGLPESSTRLKQAEPDAHELELEQDIQASLSAALDDLDKLELFAQAAQPQRPPAVMPRIPRGMPPLPHGRLIPPLPVSRLSLVPRLIQSLRPTPSSVKSAHSEPEVHAVMVPTTVGAARSRRWQTVALALLALALLGALWWLRQ